MQCNGQCEIQGSAHQVHFLYTLVQTLLYITLFFMSFRSVYRFEIVLDVNREAIPYPEVIMAAKDGIYLNFRDL